MNKVQSAKLLLNREEYSICIKDFYFRKDQLYILYDEDYEDYDEIILKLVRILRIYYSFNIKCYGAGNIKQYQRWIKKKKRFPNSIIIKCNDCRTFRVGENVDLKINFRYLYPEGIHQKSLSAF